MDNEFAKFIEKQIDPTMNFDGLLFKYRSKVYYFRDFVDASGASFCYVVDKLTKTVWNVIEIDGDTIHCTSLVKNNLIHKIFRKKYMKFIGYKIKTTNNE